MQAASGTPLNTKRIGVLAGVAVFVLAADILTKVLVVAYLRPGHPVHIVGDILEFNLLRNPGAAFSVGTGDTIVFTVIAVAVIVYILRTARRLRSTAWTITLGLLLGGACGNLVDRIFRSPGLFRGYVVDFIQVTPYWPVFNVADSAIVCGGILVVLMALLGYHMDGTRGEHASEASEYEPGSTGSSRSSGSSRSTGSSQASNSSQSTDNSDISGKSEVEAEQ